VQIFIISNKKIQNKGYETLFKYTTRNPKGAVSRYVASVPLHWQVPLAGIAVQISARTDSSRSVHPCSAF